MRKEAVQYLLRNYGMRKSERKVFDRLIQMQKGEAVQVPTTPWIDKMTVYEDGESVKAFLLIRRDLYTSTYMPNPRLL